MNNNITLKDIAKLVGVSVSTVSRVLNGDSEKVARESVKESIWKIAEEYHYIPNKTAQNLKCGDRDNHKKIFKFGIIFARIDEKDYNPFFLKLSRVISKEIVSSGNIVEFSILSAVLKNTKSSDYFKEHQVDGVFILGKFNDWLYKKVKLNVKNVIYVGLNKLIYNDIDQIICDGYTAAVSAVNYLHNQGHHKIMYLGETNNEMRYKGYCHAVRFWEKSVPRDAIMESDFTIKSSYATVAKKFDSDYTAIFCGNDMSGIGAVSALLDMGYRIPEDVSVISIDDIDLIQDYRPLLTTVHIPISEMGKMSVRTIRDRLDKVRKIPITIELPYQLVERETVQKNMR